MKFDDLKNLDLSKVREQILAYSAQLSRSYWEVGRRLHYAKLFLLPEGSFLPWLETLYIDYDEANRMMYIAKNLPKMECYEHLGLSLLYLIATIPEEHRQKVYSLPSGQRKYLHQMSQLELRTVKRLLKAGQLESCFPGDSQLQVDCQQLEKEPQDAVAPEASQARSSQSTATCQVATQKNSDASETSTPQLPTSPQANGLQSNTQSHNATHQASQSQTNLLTPSQDLKPNPLAPKLAEAQATNQRLRESLKQANAKYQEDLQSIEERYRYLKRFREGLSHFANRSTTFIPDLEGLNRIIAFSHEIDHLLVKLAPMRYIDDFKAIQNQVMVDHYLKQIDRVDDWVQSMRASIHQAQAVGRRDVTTEGAKTQASQAQAKQASPDTSAFKPNFTNPIQENQAVA
ncbi:hypothetical protein [Abiotrophia sp. HMSC24B09]|uniref:hypothetical protein n=1 Tax=Abiotrophia sp. HMSC24B09 TaxID=1581061 RepID=UPI0008A2267E|nr:hypothetical protein [Abiotrophia sp. HMSC24B09]OFS29457.1 hypothetical protein HMPREF3093_04135 [Abiotrophia sp. HMSC24B09]